MSTAPATRPGGQDRIFVIGLPRTGTTSLHLALLLLGISGIHRPLQLANLFFRGKFDQLERYPFRCFGDLPVPIYFRELHRQFPSARFIITERPADSWIESIRVFLSTREPHPTDLQVRDVLRLAMFGSSVFDEERFRRVHDRHHRDVYDYFDSRPGALLRFRVDAPAPWADLCGFLGKPTPDLPFPRMALPSIGELSAVDDRNVSRVRDRLIASHARTGDYLGAGASG